MIQFTFNLNGGLNMPAQKPFMTNSRNVKAAIRCIINFRRSLEADHHVAEHEIQAFYSLGEQKILASVNLGKRLSAIMPGSHAAWSAAVYTALDVNEEAASNFFHALNSLSYFESVPQARALMLWFNKKRQHEKGGLGSADVFYLVMSHFVSYYSAFILPLIPSCKGHKE